MLNTPKFNEPNIVFNTEDYIDKSSWSKIADLILTSDQGDVRHFMNEQKPYKNLPFIFKQLDDVLSKKISIRRGRRTAVTNFNTYDSTKRLFTRKSKDISNSIDNENEKVSIWINNFIGN
jgi:hypothetical protein